jgi:hypothetical protein
VTRRLTVALAAAALGAALLAPDALAHGIVGREDLPLDRVFFVWGAVAMLVASFVGLAVLWPKPQLEDAPERQVARIPRVLDVLAGAIGVALFGVLVWAGIDGTQSVSANLVPIFVYVVFWNLIPVLSLLLGDVFAALNPWRAIGRAASWVTGRVAPGRVPDVLPYPERLGYWPAAVSIFAFATLELAIRPSIKEDPSWLAILMLVYAGAQLVGMALYGVETWTRRGDGFAVLFRLFGALSPLHWHDGTLSVRRPLSGVPKVRAVPGTVALVMVAIGSTSFDGMRENKWWTDIALDLQDGIFETLGFGPTLALEIIYAIGMLCVILALGGLFALGVRGIQTIDRARPGLELARRFAPSLIPIALAYLVAHYFSQMAYQGQAAIQLASDPLGRGWDLFGTAAQTIDYTVVSANGIWYAQVIALVVGHVAALVLAHDRALVVFSDARDAVRSQYWMLAVMVSFTSLGLWLLSAPNE